jgi:hypothetical protein
MSCDTTIDFCVRAGATFEAVFQCATDELTTVAITAITKAAPPVITAAGHGMPDDWEAAVVSAGGMRQINAENYPPRGRDWKRARAASSDTVKLLDCNSAEYTTYTSGGFLVFSTPMVLTGVTARLIVRDAPLTGNILATLTSSPAAGLTINTTTKTVTASLATAALTWSTGYYDLELTEVSGRITQPATGVITIT